MNASSHRRRYIIFDFDSTLVQMESFPELARIALKNHAERAQRLVTIERTTELTASGKMSMADGIALRIELLDGHRVHLEALVRSLKRAVTSARGPGPSATTSSRTKCVSPA